MPRIVLAGLLIAMGSAAGGCGGGTDDVGGSPVDPIAADECLVADCRCGAIDQEDAIGPVPPDELGHWAAGRIDLPDTPYEVTGVVFGLANPSGESTTPCGSGIETEVQLFVSDSPTPPAEPVVAWSSTTNASGGDRVDFVELPVDPPVRVEPSQHLFVSFQMAGTSERFICLYSCTSVPTETAEASWWSNAADPPYAWASLAEFSLDAGYNIVGMSFDEG